PSARRLLDQAEAATTGLENDVSAMLMLLQARALGGLFEGDLDGVRSAALEGARLSREIGDLYSLEMMLINLGMVGLIERDLAAENTRPEYTAGQELSRAGAITLALGESAQPVAAHTDTADTAPLGSREAEVAQLVAEGSSNKQIGTRLFISERTVDSHVRSI